MRDAYLQKVEKLNNYSEGVEGKRASVFPLAFERNVR
jgi:hypothetical protein